MLTTAHSSRHSRLAVGASGSSTGSSPPGRISDDFLTKLTKQLQSSGIRYHDAQDAVQGAAYKAIARGAFASLLNPDGWFYKVARNDAWTSITRRREVNVERFPDPRVSPVDEVDEEDEQDHLLRAIHSAIDELPTLEQEIIRRRYFDGAKIREVADALGVSRGVVHRHQIRAEEEVREHLLNNREFARKFLGI